MSVIRKVQVRRGTASAWSTANPVLSSGEFGYDETNGKIKIGDGATAWNSLAFAHYKPSEVNDLLLDYALSGEVVGLTINTPAPEANREFSFVQDQFNLPEDGGYQNIVHRYGYNVERQNTAEPSIFVSTESKYLLNNSGPYVMEWHIEGQHVDGTPHRSFSMIVPVDKNDKNAGSSAGFYTQTFANYAFDGTQKIKYDWVDNVVTFTTAQLHRWGLNNHNFHAQLNAAGNSYVNLPYIDNLDRLYVTAPTYQVTEATYAKPASRTIATTSGADPIVWQVNAGGSDTGTMRMYYGIASRNGPATIEVFNNGSGQYSNSELVLSVGLAGGDACIRTTTTGNVGVVQGFDRSAGLYRFADNVSGYWLGSGGQILDLNPSTKHAKFYGNVVSTPASSITLGANGELAIEATSNTTLTVKYRGSDGTTRSRH